MNPPRTNIEKKSQILLSGDIHSAGWKKVYKIIEISKLSGTLHLQNIDGTTFMFQFEQGITQKNNMKEVQRVFNENNEVDFLFYSDHHEGNI